MKLDTPGQLWDVPDEVAPQWAARRALADALRELSERCVRTEVDAGALEAATVLVQQAVAGLPAGRTASEAFADGAFFEEPREYIDRGALMGRCNPVAPPMEIHTVDGHSQCRVVLGERHVGAPGIVHGGFLAACFDQVCGHCAVMNGYAGLTVDLEVRYRRPAHVHAVLHFEAAITEVSGRRATVEATCSREGDTLATCRAVFAILDSQQGIDLFGGG